MKACSVSAFAYPNIKFSVSDVTTISYKIISYYKYSGKLHQKIMGGSEISSVHLLCSQNSKSRHKYCLMGRTSKDKDRKQEYGRLILRWLHDLYLSMLMLCYNHHPLD